MICNKCNNQFEGKFCPNCGTPIKTSYTTYQNKASNKQKRRLPRGCLNTIMVAATIMLLFIIFIIFLPDDSKSIDSKDTGVVETITPEPKSNLSENTNISEKNTATVTIQPSQIAENTITPSLKNDLSRKNSLSEEDLENALLYLENIVPGTFGINLQDFDTIEEIDSYWLIENFIFSTQIYSSIAISDIENAIKSCFNADIKLPSKNSYDIDNGLIYWDDLNKCFEIVATDFYGCYTWRYNIYDSYAIDDTYYIYLRNFIEESLVNDLMLSDGCINSLLWNSSKIGTISVDNPIFTLEDIKYSWTETIPITEYALKKDAQGRFYIVSKKSSDVLNDDEFIFNYEINDLINWCGYVSYDEIARYPDRYKDKFAYFSGEVIQALETGHEWELRVDISEYGSFDSNIIYVNAPLSIDGARILEGDIISIYGTLNGMLTYESILGASITIPAVECFAWFY